MIQILQWFKLYNDWNNTIIQLWNDPRVLFISNILCFPFLKNLFCWNSFIKSYCCSLAFFCCWVFVVRFYFVVKALSNTPLSRFKFEEYCFVKSVTSKKSPNVYQSCLKTILLEKFKILTPLQKLPKNVVDLGKLIVATGFEKLPKVQ